MITTAFSHFSPDFIVERDEYHTVFRQGLSEGEGTASVYPVLQGIEVVELDLRAPRYHPEIRPSAHVLEINHCQAGRSECRMKDGCFQYVGEGDLFLSTLRNHSEVMELPLGYYRGMTILIDTDTAASGIAGMLPGVRLDMQELSERFFTEDECFLIQAREETRHIFSGMYTAPKEARSACFRLKALELLLYLYYLDPLKEKRNRMYAGQQVEIVKQIRERITGEPGRRFTIEELAREYCISPTALKSGFKGVYGVSIAAYMKEYRIRQAASLLRQTQLSVAEVALEMGYESQSKFGAAFKESMKTTPMEYRKKHTAEPK